MSNRTSRETSIQSSHTESLPDLPLTDEQAEETKAGSRSPFGETFNGGVFVG